MEEDIHAGEMEPAIEEERQAVYLPSPLLISPQVFHSKLESHLFKNSFHNLSFAVQALFSCPQRQVFAARLFCSVSLVNWPTGLRSPLGISFCVSLSMHVSLCLSICVS